MRAHIIANAINAFLSNLSIVLTSYGLTANLVGVHPANFIISGRTTNRLSRLDRWRGPAGLLQHFRPHVGDVAHDKPGKHELHYREGELCWQISQHEDAPIIK